VGDLEEEGPEECYHAGIECEVLLVCSTGCTCPDCIEACNTSWKHECAPVTKDTSDGYHTFADLYRHRMALTLALCHSGAGRTWRSKQHHPDDGPMFEGSFIVGIELPSGTITYHYNLQHWDAFEGVRELEFAKKWDGATPDDSIVRLINYRSGWTCY
jgi:hypothetical protein